MPYIRKIGTMYVVFDDKGVPVESAKTKKQAEKIAWAYTRTDLRRGGDK